jgi:hypothetical protein
MHLMLHNFTAYLGIFYIAMNTPLPNSEEILEMCE